MNYSFPPVRVTFVSYSPSQTSCFRLVIVNLVKARIVTRSSLPAVNPRYPHGKSYSALISLAGNQRCYPCPAIRHNGRPADRSGLKPHPSGMFFKPGSYPANSPLHVAMMSTDTEVKSRPLSLNFLHPEFLNPRLCRCCVVEL